MAICSLSQLSSALVPLHVMLQPGLTTNWTLPEERVLLRASQQMLGAGEVSGTFLLELQRGSLSADRVTHVASNAARPTLIVCSRTTMPWFLRPWIHTLAATVDGVDTSLQKVLHPRRHQAVPGYCNGYGTAVMGLRLCAVYSFVDIDLCGECGERKCWWCTIEIQHILLHPAG